MTENQSTVPGAGFVFVVEWEICDWGWCDVTPPEKVKYGESEDGKGYVG